MGCYRQQKHREDGDLIWVVATQIFFVFIPIWGRCTQFDYIIFFQMGWNHQLVMDFHSKWGSDWVEGSFKIHQKFSHFWVFPFFCWCKETYSFSSFGLRMFESKVLKKIFLRHCVSPYTVHMSNSLQQKRCRASRNALSFCKLTNVATYLGTPERR